MELSVSIDPVGLIVIAVLLAGWQPRDVIRLMRSIGVRRPDSMRPVAPRADLDPVSPHGERNGRDGGHLPKETNMRRPVLVVLGGVVVAGLIWLGPGLYYIASNLMVSR